jgi:bifunctional enzyme CysN/CysC
MSERRAAVGPAASEPAQSVDDYMARQAELGVLRFITCGSVDDGKSTLIGRLLYDSKLIFEDQLKALESDSRKFGTQGREVDLALLVDGLAAEREQGITIDVAYRYFASQKRKFIVADTPGHEQYTRNMATGASTADLAVILVDARNGVLTQTRRHSCIAALLGIRQVVLAVNKMDAVGWRQAMFDGIAAEYRAFAAEIGLDEVHAVPLSALKGDNVLLPSRNMAWYRGPTLLSLLETVDVASSLYERPFRLPVQWVNRPDASFRGYAGSIASGRVHAGDEIAVLPGGRTSRVRRIVTGTGEREEAGAGEAVTLTLADEIDVSRGDVIAPAAARPESTDQFQATVIWMHEHHLLPGRSYLLKTANRTVGASVTEIKGRIDVHSLHREAAKVLELNEIGICNLSLDVEIAFDPYAENRSTGSFILIDRVSNETVAAGMIDFGLRRARNIHWQAVDIDKAARATQKRQMPRILWFTGLSGSGKSTIANVLERMLQAQGRHTYLLDGDNVRHGLNRDLGFTEADRVENIRRVGEVAKLMLDAGLIVLVSFISPFRAEREMVRKMVGADEFVEIFVDTPLAVCEARDPKGLYGRARAGEIKNFTGIDSPYEAPETPELRLDTTRLSVEESAEEIMAYLAEPAP